LKLKNKENKISNIIIGKVINKKAFALKALIKSNLNKEISIVVIPHPGHFNLVIKKKGQIKPSPP